LNERLNENGETPQAPRRTALLRLGVGTLLVLLLMAGFKGYRDFKHVKGQEAALEAKIAATEERIAGLKTRIGRINHDPAALEQIAREELGWVRDGDVVIFLPEEKAPSAR
jgi:cell division protein FtsB